MAGKHVVKTKLTGNKSDGKRRRGFYYVIATLTLWLLLIAVISSIVAFALMRPPREPLRKIKVVVERGYNSTQIADLLARKKVVGNAYTFRLYAVLNNVDEHMLPGRYTFTNKMSYRRIADILAAGPKKTIIKVVIPEGLTLKEVNRLLAAKTGRRPAEFQAVTTGSAINDYNFRSLPVGATDLEGYLFPKTYYFDKKSPPKKIIARLLRQYDIETADIDWSLAARKSMSHNDIIIIASLIEKEAKVPEERSLMAAVIYNRLARGMPLQIDATIQYILPRRKERLSTADTKINSPYNTYLHKGLPPGPIANPGLESIKAALAPAAVDYLYYVLTSPDGHHTFTRTYAEFLKAKRQAAGGG